MSDVRTLLAHQLSSWMRNSLIAAATSVICFALMAWAWPWRPGRFGGLVFGTASALLFVNAGAYPWRRRWQARPLGTARRWLLLHSYGSTLAMLFVLLHMGMQWPVGLMGWLLLLLSAWTTATGLAGLWLQRAIPRLLVSRSRIEAIYERIPELVLKLVAEADELMDGAADALATVYAAEVRPSLRTPRTSLGWLTGSADTRMQVAAPLERLRSFLGVGDQARVDDLVTIIHDKTDLDAHLSLQRLLRNWLILHVPPAIALIGLIVTHVLAVVWH